MSVDLGQVDVLGAEAVGQPGQRRFRLFARSRRGSAIMWMEKEQLNGLSLALDRFLAQLTEGQVLRTEAQAGQRPKPEGMPRNFPSTPDYEFQVAQIKIGYDEAGALFLLSVTPLEIVMEPGQEPEAVIDEDAAVSFFFSQGQAERLTTAIGVLVTSGRPVCPLCGTPLDGGPHACVKQNGHHKIILVDEEEEEE
ncbi:MAG TPA: DUF3090 family protein [Ktedonobacteraceae bacterium]|nr:DUF3090 family protein [Ktedonobacteraceae bacterium]